MALREELRAQLQPLAAEPPCKPQLLRKLARRALARMHSRPPGLEPHDLMNEFLAELLERKRARVVQIIREHEPLFEGLSELIDKLAGRFRLALASGSERAVVANPAAAGAVIKWSVEGKVHRRRRMRVEASCQVRILVK